MCKNVIFIVENQIKSYTTEHTRSHMERGLYKQEHVCVYQRSALSRFSFHPPNLKETLTGHIWLHQCTCHVRGAERSSMGPDPQQGQGLPLTKFLTSRNECHWKTKTLFSKLNTISYTRSLEWGKWENMSKSVSRLYSRVDLYWVQTKNNK